MNHVNGFREGDETLACEQKSPDDNEELGSSNGLPPGIEGDCESDLGESSDESLEEADPPDLSDHQLAMLNLSFREARLRARARDPTLPATVTTLSIEHEGQPSKIYLIGTAHFSEVSNEEVAQLIKEVCPDRIVLELDQSRSNILFMDEQRLMDEARSYNFNMFRRQMKENGMWYSLMHYLLLRMSTSLVEQLGMAPGGEFRAAARASVSVPGCTLFYGDRPVGLTLRRAFSQLSLFSRLRLASALLSSLGPVSKEDVERLKKSDLVESMVKELQDQFPILSRVFVDERDRYLARAIFDYATQRPFYPCSQEAPLVLVAVVGMGHVAGIVRYWDSVQSIDRMELCSLPEPARSGALIRRGLRYVFYGLVLYGGFRFAENIWDWIQSR